MKRKDITSLNDLTVEELTKQANELNAKISAQRVSQYTKQTKNVREIKNMRLKVAVLKTLIRQKELQHG